MDIAFALGCLCPATITGITDAAGKWICGRANYIPNAVTIPMLAAGIIFGLYTGSGLDMLLGFAFAFAVGLWAGLAGALGGGDIKLMAALGAWLGLHLFIKVFIAACIIGIFWGIADLFLKGKLKEWCRQIIDSLRLVFISGRLSHLIVRRLPEENQDKLSAGVVPFGTCLALALWILVLRGVCIV